MESHGEFPSRGIELIGAIDEEHRLQARAPADVPTGPVRIIVLPLNDDGTSGVSAQEVEAPWSDELKDTRQDIYTVDDGSPVDAP
jgi:hypothetical protein